MDGGANEIRIRGARQHNLQNIDVTIPRNRFVVITGVSGSGKSSLAMDTLFAEGQRRYVESLSAYARQFVGLLDKPDVDSITGLSPAIAIDQKSLSRNPRSTVGTATEIYDFLRILFAGVGKPHCPICGREIGAVSLEEMRSRLLELEEGARIWIFAPIVRDEKGAHRRLLQRLAREGYLRVRVDGDMMELTDDIKLQPEKSHTVEVLVDRLAVRPDAASRLSDSLETTAKLSDGIVLVEPEGADPLHFSEKPLCVRCGIVSSALTPKLFSFNDPAGACPECDGLGKKTSFAPESIVPDPNRSLDAGAVAPWSSGDNKQILSKLKTLSVKMGFSTDAPFAKLPQKAQQVLLFGDRTFVGAIPWLEKKWESEKDPTIREVLERFTALQTCSRCSGARLRPEALAVKVAGKTIDDYTSLAVGKLRRTLARIELSGADRVIAERILEAVDHRLALMERLQLNYITLNRSSETLSGGEAQRIRLAGQLGANLVGILYILDEPSIGLHPKDQVSLLEILKELRESGNSVVVVEHDAETISAADYVIDMGPGAGELGGRVMYAGPSESLAECEQSLTGAYLSGKRRIPVSPRRKISGPGIEILGACGNNLKDIDVRFPLHCFTCVTGVSGSGKSTLVVDTLYGAASAVLNRTPLKAGRFREIKGLLYIDKVIDIDQSPIGRTPRSNPATYTGVFSHIRNLFAQLPEAKMRGYKAGRFSFNVKGGRCETCQGDGVIRIEMPLLADVYATCERCKGARYHDETLEIRFKGLNIAQVLELTINEAVRFFENVPGIAQTLTTLQAVGLGYLRLGQPANTLSGGEAQRIKLAKELSKRQTGRTLYILDEPTTGLHFEDIRRLLDVLKRLVDAGNTVIVIEHNIEMIRCADCVIDLGPGPGEDGGRVMAWGSPEEVADVRDAPTAPYLKKAL